METKFATINYASHDLLNRFHKKLRSGWFDQRDIVTRCDDLNNQVRIALGMGPDMHVKIVLMPTKKEVQEKYFELYNIRVRFVSFYSQVEKTIYLSIADLSVRKYAHEFAHAVIDHYFIKQPPRSMHELMAQHVETIVR